MLEHFEEA
jgi:hypothetical protein